MNKYIAEFFGTFWLVLGGCGSAVLAAGFPEVGIGLLGGIASLWINGADHGVRHWAYLGMPFKPGSFHRSLGRRAVSSQPAVSLYCCAGSRRTCRRRCVVCDRQRSDRL